MVWHSHSSDLPNATSNKQLSDEEVQKLFDDQRLQMRKIQIELE
jgi:hypothetical protein